MRLVVVVDELGFGLVAAAANHAGRCGVWLNCKLVSTNRDGGVLAVDLHFFSQKGFSFVLGPYEP
jgi:hypothetical protein